VASGKSEEKTREKKKNEERPGTGAAKLPDRYRYKKKGGWGKIKKKKKSSRKPEKRKASNAHRAPRRVLCCTGEKSTQTRKTIGGAQNWVGGQGWTAAGKLRVHPREQKKREKQGKVTKKKDPKKKKKWKKNLAASKIPGTKGLQKGGKRTTGGKKKEKKKERGWHTKKGFLFSVMQSNQSKKKDYRKTKNWPRPAKEPEKKGGGKGGTDVRKGVKKTPTGLELLQDFLGKKTQKEAWLVGEGTEI